MLFLFVLVAAAVVAFVVWRTLGAEQTASDRAVGPPEAPGDPVTGSRPAPPRASGPDDDPEFLRSLDEKVKGRDEEPPAGTTGT